MIDQQPTGYHIKVNSAYLHFLNDQSDSDVVLFRTLGPDAKAAKIKNRSIDRKIVKIGFIVKESKRRPTFNLTRDWVVTRRSFTNVEDALQHRSKLEEKLSKLQGERRQIRRDQLISINNGNKQGQPTGKKIKKGKKKREMREALGIYKPTRRSVF